MPLYIYMCGNCGKQREMMKTLSELEDSEERIHTCDKCSTEDRKVYMTRVPSCTNFKLKGYGWAADGYSEYLADDPKFKAGTFTMNDLKEDEDV